MSATFAPDPRRARLHRTPTLNGLDEVEPAPDRRTLLVRFFHDAPDGLAPANLAITGGVVVRAIRVLDVARHKSDDPDMPVLAAVSVDRIGDASTYQLQLVGLDHIDPRYAAAPFSFFPDLDDDTDCGCAPTVTPPSEAAPPIDYLAKDYPGFRQVMLDRLAVTIPDWRERHVPDVGIMLVELLAYVADRLSYYQDAVATEAYLGTARRRISVRRHVRLIDYAMHEGCAARVLVQFVARDAVAVDVAGIAVLPVGDETTLFRSLGGGRRAFPAIGATLAVHTWGQRGGVLASGATTATLVDPAPDQDPLLAADEFVVFELLVAGRADPDPDPRRRHAARLTAVTRRTDPLLEKPLLEIAWAGEDALPADFPIDDTGGAPVTVVLGNLLLMQHGQRVTEGDKVRLAPAAGPGRRSILTLANPNLGFAEPVAPGASALAILSRREPRRAVPLIDRLQSWPAVWSADPASPPPRTDWIVRPDLIGSGPDDPHVAVEMDDDGIAHLRFGDGVCGRKPDGQLFEVAYCVGNGPAGNVGADCLVRPNQAHWSSRNPLPAGGGAAPEDVMQVKLLAPHAFHDSLVRGVTAEDYAALAVQLEPAVQRAAASLVPSGGRLLARVALDPRGSDLPAPALIARVAAALEPYRRIGHDLLVVQGEYVPLLLVLQIELQDGYLQGHIRRAVRAAVGTGIRPDGTRGPFHPDNLSFGTPLYTSRLIAAVQALDGVAAVTVVELARLFDRERGLVVGGVLAMAWNEIPQLDADPLRPDHGRLVLRLSGGIA